MAKRNKHGRFIVTKDGYLYDTRGYGCSFDIEGYEDVRQGRWIVGVPNKYKEYSEEINDCMNDNVPWGCCGGCL